MNNQFKEELKEDVKSALFRLSYCGFDEIEANQFFQGHVTIHNYANIMGLYTYAARHKELSNAQLEAMIKGGNCFKFLNQFIATLPNAIEELKLQGALDATIDYAEAVAQKLASNSEEL